MGRRPPREGRLVAGCTASVHDGWTSPHMPSPRTCHLLGEVDMCAGEIEALHQKLGGLRDALNRPEYPSGGRGFDDDSDLLEAERNLDEYFRRGSSGGCSRRFTAVGAVLEPSKNSLSDYLPVASVLDVQCPAARTGHGSRSLPASPRRRTEETHTSLQCQCDPRLILPQVWELHELVELREAEIHTLQNELQCAPVTSPEFVAMTGENSALSRRVRDSVARVAVLRTENAALTWSVDADRERAQELRMERRKLLERIGSIEREEVEALNIRDKTESQLEAERQQTREQVFGHESALEALTDHAETAERHWSTAEAAVVQLQLKEAQSEVDAAAESRASLLEVERGRQRMLELDAQLSKENAGAEMVDINLQHAAVGAQLAEVCLQTSELRGAESVLAARLAASRHRGEETERKAMSVARELVDSSQAIAWLHKEISAQREVRLELQETERRVASLKKHLQEPEQEAIPGEAGHAAENGSQGFCTREPVQAARPHVAPAIAVGVLAMVAAQAELNEIRTGQVHAVNEALREAWEAEAREHRVVQRRLHTLETCMRPVQQQLLRLTEIARLWREDLLRSRPVAERRTSAANGKADRGGGSGIAETELPSPPSELCWDDEGRRPEAVKALCACVEVLAAETSHRLAEVDSSRRLAISTQQSASESFILRAERLALERELERLTPLHDPHKEACHNPAVLQSPQLTRRTNVSASSLGTGHGSVGIRDQPEKVEQTSPSTSSRQVVHQENTIWPSSPVPRERAALRGNNAGGMANRRSTGALWSSVSLHEQRGLEASSLVGLESRGGVAASWSSMSLHDQRRPEAAPRSGVESTVAQRSEEPRRLLADQERPYLQLQRGPSSTGLLSRLERSTPRPLEAQSRIRSNSGTGTFRRGGALRQIPVRRSLDGVLNDPSDRFDAYSVHRPLHGAGLL